MLILSRTSITVKAFFIPVASIKSILSILLLFVLCGGVSAQGVEDQTTLVFPTLKHIPIRKAGKYHLFLFTGTSVKINDPQGVAVVKLDSRNDPNTKKDDDEVTVYGVNSGDGVIIYNTSMTSVSVFGKDLPDDLKMSSPHGIAATPGGRVFVADTGNDRIMELEDRGELIFVRTIGETGSSTGRFQSPRDVAIDSHDRIYVADTGNDRIQVLSDEGEVLKVWGADSGLTLHQPISIAVVDREEKLNRFRENFAVISDEYGKVLRRVDFDGKEQVKITGADFGYPDAVFGYLALDLYNNVYATDPVNHCVHKFNRKLLYLTTFGRKGENKNEFIEPRGIGIWKRLGQVVIAERETAQYFWIGTEIKHVNVIPRPPKIGFEIFITESSYLKVDIFDEEGNFIKRLGKLRKRYHAGTAIFEWDMLPGVLTEEIVSEDGYSRLRNLPKGVTLPPGKYRLKITARATYSSKRHFADEVEVDFVIPEMDSLRNFNHSTDLEGNR